MVVVVGYGLCVCGARGKSFFKVLLGVTLYLRTSLGEERAHLETDAIGAASDSRALTFQRKNRRHFDPKNSVHRWPSSLLLLFIGCCHPGTRNRYPLIGCCTRNC